MLKLTFFSICYITGKTALYLYVEDPLRTSFREFHRRALSAWKEKGVTPEIGV